MLLSYRVYDKEEKEYSDKAFSLDQYGILYVQDEDGYWEEASSARYVLEFSTGFEDKNGKEIYEGDRIKIEGSDTVYTVEYGRGVWVARFGDESGDNICLYHYVQKDIVLYAEVIGNIHENPELLEEEK